jgi:hypothetical protein
MSVNGISQSSSNHSSSGSEAESGTPARTLSRRTQQHSPHGRTGALAAGPQPPASNPAHAENPRRRGAAPQHAEERRHRQVQGQHQANLEARVADDRAYRAAVAANASNPSNTSNQARSIRPPDVGAIEHPLAPQVIQQPDRLKTQRLVLQRYANKASVEMSRELLATAVVQAAVYYLGKSVPPHSIPLSTTFCLISTLYIYTCYSSSKALMAFFKLTKAQDTLWRLPQVHAQAPSSTSGSGSD